MKTNGPKRIPVGVLLIAAFYIFGAMVLLIGIFTNPGGVRETVALAHGLSPVIGLEFVLAVAALALVLAYGLVRLSRWGLSLAVGYSLYLCLAALFMGGLSFLWTGQPATRILFGNFLWSGLVVIYLVIARRHFSGPRLKDHPS